MHRIFGKTKDALNDEPLNLESCDKTLQILPGTHRLVSEPGRLTGLNIDRLMLASPSNTTVTKTSLPTIRTLQQGHTNYKLSVKNANEPFWLILGQSYNEGWKLSTSDENIQESPILINGFSNGWLIDPSSSVSDFEIDID